MRTAKLLSLILQEIYRIFAGAGDDAFYGVLRVGKDR